MPNPTRQQIIDAHNALASLVCVVLSNTSDPDEKDWIRTIARALTAALPPKPQSTMAEIEWEDDKHYLAEAEHGAYSGVVMLSKNALSGTVRVLAKIGDINDVRAVEAVELTPTGKRYTLTEVQE
ncbi:hypothetical protein QP902_10025 [Corynebacterium marquesiae]|uniref:hypothetical protein n=1 Tax=Corynebacterium marquesiae TaxID=2913503 RepID=UPI00254ACF5A|nr:hypothetical protein [Corynebacterium marquesiae]MDK8669008.1 hypothetical protein [Corynebacterium marquesiae]